MSGPGRTSARLRRAGVLSSKAGLVIARQALPGRGSPPSLNRFQEHFCTWNAQRLGIPREESVARFHRSSQTIRGGHRGAGYRLLVELVHDLFQPFAADSPDEVWEAYRLHAHAHLLRFLSYKEPVWRDGHPVLQALDGRRQVTIVDFGCGLAQYSITLAERLQGEGREVRLVLADIPTIAFDFLGWLVRELGVEAELRACGPERPVPELLPCDLLIAREFFEHVHDPVSYLERFDAYVQPGGLLLGDMRDHREEFMHTSPSLERLRARARELGYRPAGENLLAKAS